MSERSPAVKAEFKSFCVPGRVPHREEAFHQEGTPLRSRALAEFIEIEPESEGLTGQVFQNFHHSLSDLAGSSQP